MTTFGRFTVDSDTRQLRRDGRAVHLSPKAFELLLALLAARPRVLSKADLQDRLWPHTFVAEANLSNLVAEVRKAIGDTSRAPRFLRTAHGFGYAFFGGGDDGANPGSSGAAPTRLLACLGSTGVPLVRR
jgi:DNA-binding winged helix-turn-helix (wHTH) protein